MSCSPGPRRSARSLLPRSLAGSLAVHTAVVGAGVMLGLLAEGRPPRDARVFVATFAAGPAAEPEPREELEPLAEPELAEPELSESVVWAAPDFPLASAAGPEVPPAVRAVDWVAERPLAIGTLAAAEPLPPTEPAPSAVAAPSPPAPVVREPIALHAPAPAYPRLSRRAGEEGTVLCRIVLDASGVVLAVEVVQSSGHARLDEAAREALASWIFEPRREDGRAVPGSLLHRVTFRLSES